MTRLDQLQNLRDQIDYAGMKLIGRAIDRKQAPIHDAGSEDGE